MIKSIIAMLEYLDKSDKPTKLLPVVARNEYGGMSIVSGELFCSTALAYKRTIVSCEEYPRLPKEQSYAYKTLELFFLEDVDNQNVELSLLQATKQIRGALTEEEFMYCQGFQVKQPHSIVPDLDSNNPKVYSLEVVLYMSLRWLEECRTLRKTA